MYHPTYMFCPANFHPGLLESLGLVALLKRICTEFCTQYKLQVQFIHKDIPKEIPSNVALCSDRSRRIAQRRKTQWGVEG